MLFLRQPLPLKADLSTVNTGRHLNENDLGLAVERHIPRFLLHEIRRSGNAGGGVKSRSDVIIHTHAHKTRADYGGIEQKQKNGSQNESERSTHTPGLLR